MAVGALVELMGARRPHFPTSAYFVALFLPEAFFAGEVFLATALAALLTALFTGVATFPAAFLTLVLALAVPLHMGIAFCMGMITFGVIMLVGNKLDLCEQAPQAR